MHEDKVYRVGEQPLLNGLFGVSNQEWVDSVEVLRIIMNLTPSNAIFRGFDGDVGTLPPWAGISPLHLPPHEQLLISSEDVRAFILHRFRAQSSWHPPLFFMLQPAVPVELCGAKAGRWFPCGAVLPMEFKKLRFIATTTGVSSGTENSTDPGRNAGQRS